MSANRARKREVSTRMMPIPTVGCSLTSSRKASQCRGQRTRVLGRHSDARSEPNERACQDDASQSEWSETNEPCGDEQHTRRESYGDRLSYSFSERGDSSDTRHCERLVQQSVRRLVEIQAHCQVGKPGYGHE